MRPCIDGIISLLKRNVDVIYAKLYVVTVTLFKILNSLTFHEAFFHYMTNLSLLLLSQSSPSIIVICLLYMSANVQFIVLLYFKR
jgi:hypothetical protein